MACDAPWNRSLHRNMDERNGDVVARSSHNTLSALNPCVAVPKPVEVVEITTVGTRPTIEFFPIIPPSSGQSCMAAAGAREKRSHADTHTNFYSKMASTKSLDDTADRVWSRLVGNKAKSRNCCRRTSAPPLDGVRLTLLGVSVGLKAPGSDPWGVARALTECSVDLRTRNSHGMTPLHVACVAGQLDVAWVLLLAGADCHARDKRSRCPLHMAASSGNEELVKLLIAAGAHVKKASANGTTPLHNAALLGRVGVVRALLLAGANPDAIDRSTFSPIYLASQNGHVQVVQDLLAAGADPSIKTAKGFTALHVAARCGRLAVVCTLLDAGVPVDCGSALGMITPLHLAAGFSRADCVDELLKRGADPTRENRRSFTPLDLAGSLSPSPPTVCPCASASASASTSASASASASTYASARTSHGGASLSLDRSEPEPCVSPQPRWFDSPIESETTLWTEEERASRVRRALIKARVWQRRRVAVLLFSRLRFRFYGPETLEGVNERLKLEEDVEEKGDEGHRGEHIANQGPRNKRPKRCSGDYARSLGEESFQKACDAAVIQQVCAHPDPLVMRYVLTFL